MHLQKVGRYYNIKKKYKAIDKKKINCTQIINTSLFPISESSLRNEDEKGKWKKEIHEKEVSTTERKAPSSVSDHKSSFSRNLLNYNMRQPPPYQADAKLASPYNKLMATR